MTIKAYKALIRQYHGWLDGDWIRFPTPWHKEQFQRAVEAYHETLV